MKKFEHYKVEDDKVLVQVFEGTVAVLQPAAKGLRTQGTVAFPAVLVGNMPEDDGGMRPETGGQGMESG